MSILKQEKQFETKTKTVIPLVENNNAGVCRCVQKMGDCLT